MVGVAIDSGPIGISNDSRNTPRDRWRALVEFRRDYIHLQYGFDCRSIVEWLNDSDRMWRELGYQSLDEMVRKGLEIDPADALLVAEWLRRYKPDYPVGLPDAIEYALRNRGGQPGNKNASKDKPQNERYNRNLRFRGNSDDYITARIARDRPDILEDMKQGKYRSVRQAAIEAGIVNPKMRYSLPDDPIQAARYLAKRVDREWLLCLVEALEAINDPNQD
jgi:hypothetical protein